MRVLDLVNLGRFVVLVPFRVLLKRMSSVVKILVELLLLLRLCRFVCPVVVLKTRRSCKDVEQHCVVLTSTIE